MSLWTRSYCQRARPDHAVAALTLAGFENVQGGEDADLEQVEGRKQVHIFRLLASQQDVVDDHVVALRGHGGDGVPHAPEDSLGDRPGPDDDGGLAVLVHGFEGDPVPLSETGFRQHPEEGIHLDMQEALGRYRLQRLRDGAFASAADAVEKDDSSCHAAGPISE
jgi:hypothetical protein